MTETKSTSKPLNILWHSAAPFMNSGYGVQTREWVWRLMKDGHKVACVFAATDWDVPKMRWNGIDILPGGPSRRGLDGVYHYAKKLNVDLVITLFDIWPIPPEFGADLAALGVDWMPIVPVDSSPITPASVPVLKTAKYPTAMSLFGQEEMKRVGVRPQYFPHGVDTNVFKPEAVDKELFSGYDDKFIVGCVANNVEPHDRKGLVQTIEAFGKFHKKHPKSVFYFHGDPSASSGGIDMINLAKANGFEFFVTEWWDNYEGLSDVHMAKMYNFFDVFLMLTGGEGFGVPLIEAQSCDTNAIVTDFSAPKDLVAESGWKVPIGGRRWTLKSTYWGVADVENAVESLSDAYRRWKDGTLKDGKAREFALNYDYDLVYKKYLTPILNKVHKARYAKVRSRKSKKDK